MAEYIGSLSIKSWAEEDRPREKLLSKGCGNLSEAELIAILIGSGNRDESAVELSKRILSSTGNNLNELGKLSIRDLIKFKGIGEAKAISIVAAIELGKRRRLSEVKMKEKISSSVDIFEHFQHLVDLPNEEFWILLLNRGNKIITKYNISKGGVSGTVADAKIIFKYTLEHLASSLILCHNHPSGNLQPSEADIKLTKKIKEAGVLLDILVLDHLIVAETGYFSFADQGMI